MPRILFNNKKQLNKYFSELKEKSSKSWLSISDELEISNRQLTDWKNGKCSMSYQAATIIKKKYNIDLPEKIQIKKDRWHLTDSAIKGGKRRYQLYGQIGSLASRRKGGINAIKVLQHKNTNFRLAKKITIPQKDVILSEIVGAFIGDGSISKSQARIYLNLKTDKLYAQHLASCIRNIFDINVTVSYQNKRSTVEIWTSSVSLVKYLHKIGLPIGDKNKQGLDVPQWILKNKKFYIACLRGIFDTDGCTYIDKHCYKNKIYKNIGIVYTTYSPKLISTISRLLSDLGYTPTLKSKNRVFMRRKYEVMDFFDKIRPANKRHQLVFNQFMEGYRSGCNGSASKAVV